MESHCLWVFTLGNRIIPLVSDFGGFSSKWMSQISTVCEPTGVVSPTMRWACVCGCDTEEIHYMKQLLLNILAGAQGRNEGITPINCWDVYVVPVSLLGARPARASRLAPPRLGRSPGGGSAHRAAPGATGAALQRLRGHGGEAWSAAGGGVIPLR